MRKNWIILNLLMVAALLLSACAALGPEPQASFAAPEPQTSQLPVEGPNAEFVVVNSPVSALTSVRVIDGTGADPLEDQTILISDGKIAAVGDNGTVDIPEGVEPLDLPGYSVLPGFVGMHDHMFYPMGGSPATPNDPPQQAQMSFSFSRLYLAHGVTTIRTTGSIAPYADLELKLRIDKGEMIGPKIHVTGPYLEGQGTWVAMAHQLTGPDDARQMVNFWADQGATSFKVYNYLTRAELEAIVDEAHARGLKVTGHLCSITYREASEIGIDNLEHGLHAATDFMPNKQPDECPPEGNTISLLNLDMNSPEVAELIRILVENDVALTSTLAIWEAGAPLTDSGFGDGSAVMNPKKLSTMAPHAIEHFLAERDGLNNLAPQEVAAYKVLYDNHMEFERAFVEAGGHLMVGSDTTGNGGIVAGFDNLRAVELLVVAGFTPLEAIQIATLNGAEFLGEDDSIGSIEVGKQADLMVVNGNPAENIRDLEMVQLVFKDGIGWNSQKLIDSVQGMVGIR